MFINYKTINNNNIFLLEIIHIIEIYFKFWRNFVNILLIGKKKKKRKQYDSMKGGAF